MNALRDDPVLARWHPAIAAVGVYFLSGAVVSAAVLFGNSFIARREHPTQNSPGFINAFTSWDGRWYVRIVNEGYSYEQDRWSSVAFFPAYPFLGHCIKRLTGLRAEVALLVVSHVCLIATFVMLAFYTRQRYADVDPSQIDLTLLAFAFFPPTLFFRMAYTESLFMLCTIVALYAMERKRGLLSIAFVVGLATGVRSVGIALLAPLALEIWDRARDGRLRIVELLLTPFVACWGLLAFMAYLAHRFAEPLAFAKAQASWNQRPEAIMSDYVSALLTLEPIWSVFDPASPAYWNRYSSQPTPVFSIQVLNVACFVGVTVVIALGIRRQVLNSREALLAGLLLGIPYFTHSYQTLMWSEARFSAVVFPVYLIIGQSACQLPAWIVSGLIGISAFLLGAYTALFATWHLVF